MARHTKQYLDYFSHDTNMSNDPKIEYIEAKHKITAYGIYNKLLEKIYGMKGYYVDWPERDLIIFANRNNIDLDVCINIINDCIIEGLFCSELFDNFKILTSERIQKTYLSGCDRRKETHLVPEYLLIDVESFIKSENLKIKPVYDSNGVINVNINKQNASSGTQTKIKETKLNKKKRYGEYKHVLLTADQYKKLESDLGADILLEMIKKVDEGIQIKGYKYKDHNLVIRKWLKKDKKNGNQNNSGSDQGNRKRAKGILTEEEIRDELSTFYESGAETGIPEE